MGVDRTNSADLRPSEETFLESPVSSLTTCSPHERHPLAHSYLTHSLTHSLVRIECCCCL